MAFCVNSSSDGIMSSSLERGRKEEGAQKGGMKKDVTVEIYLIYLTCVSNPTELCQHNILYPPSVCLWLTC